MRTKNIIAVSLFVIMTFMAILTAPMTVNAAPATPEEQAAADRFLAAIKAAREATDGTEAEKDAAAVQAANAFLEESAKENANKNTVYDLAAAQEIFALVNAERAAAGIPELVWDDTAYAIAMQRCYENDRHDSTRTGTGENYASGNGYESLETADMAAHIHQVLHDSQGHYDNYMNTRYNRGAVAVTRVNGAYVAYEVFFVNGKTYSADLWQPKTDGVTTGFDPAYYAQTYPDVAEALGTDTEALHNHYITNGISEGRFPNALAAGTGRTANTANGQYAFDPVFYAQTYPDVAAALGTDAGALYNHYITYGRNEGRLPNANAAN
ncbi:MAG: CAP domain-containing protein [Lachnospiraceae bacterium]|nr:CAP domain-containing protein [Lachnospiraceae bacterium]